MRFPPILLLLLPILVVACASPNGSGGTPDAPEPGEGPAPAVSVPEVTERAIRIEWVNLNPRRKDPALGLINRSSPELRQLYRNHKAWSHVKPVEDEVIGVLLRAFREEGFYEHATEGRGSDTLRMGEGHGAVCVRQGDETRTLVFGPGMVDTPIPELYLKLKHNIIHVHRTTLHLAPSSPQDPNRVFRVPTHKYPRR